MKSFNKVKTTIATLLIICLSVVFLSLKRDDKLFSINKNLDIFHTLIRELNLLYVDDVNIDKMMKTGVDEMLKTLDPYTTFIPEEEMDDFKFMTTGEYAGVGALIGKKGDYIIISEPYKDFPADKAGLKAGDIILEINGKSMKGMEVSEVSNNLKGAPKEIVNIKVERYGHKKPITANVVRESIHIDAVPYYGMITNEVGYISLTSFTTNCGDEIRKLVKELKENNGAKALVLDLRGNPGGLLDEAVKIVSAFVPKNTKVLFTKGKVAQWDKEYYTADEPIDTEIPLTILVSRGSASASEIVSGALQDLDRAIIIGNRTFGKGLVQTTRDLNYKTKLKVTTAKYYVPSGRCIQALDYSNRNEDGSVGIVPDSLITEFETKSGRKVYDGGGITPDIKVPLKTANTLIFYLISEYKIFDFATKFYYTNESIAKPEEFKITDQIYTDFKKFVKESDFSYESETEKTLDELEKTAKEEKYYAIAEKQFVELRKSLAHELDRDLDQFREDISFLLKNEIVTRYYHQKGAIKASLIDDDALSRAKDVICSTDSLNKYFNPKITIEKEK